jgi:rare lipoprotein A
MEPTYPMTDTLRRPHRRLFSLLVLAAAVAMAPGGLVKADVQSTADLAGALGRGLVTLVQEGIVSWYGAAFHDRRTASGERFDADALTMAHPSLPFGTRVKVTNLRNGRSIVVRVNDRGPFVGRRIADLSQAAAEELGMMRRGVAKARIEVLPAAPGDAG